jgi:hypothetical protein
VVGDKVHYRFEVWSIIDVDRDLTISPKKKGRTLVYALPEGGTLSVKEEEGRWVFNEHSLRERWPTKYRRELVAGPYVIKVRPEDEALFFEVKGSRPRVDEALVGFYAAMPTGD